jgi:hypothetical protein
LLGLLGLLGGEIVDAAFLQHGTLVIAIIVPVVEVIIRSRNCHGQCQWQYKQYCQHVRRKAYAGNFLLHGQLL